MTRLGSRQPRAGCRSRLWDAWPFLTLPARFSTLLIAAIAVLGAGHILVRTSTHGAAVEWDSVAYLSAAESLAAGDGLRRPGFGVMFVQWPPLLPMLLALLVPFGLEPVDSARFVNALAFGLTIALAGFWLGRNLDSRLLALAGTVAVATAAPLNDIFSYAMSEPLFILFTLLALMGLESFLNRTDAAMRLLALAAGWTALAAVTRYVGVVVILVGVLLVLTRRDLRAAARLKHAAVYGAISSVPLALVLARNWSVSGTLAGRRNGSGQSLFDSLVQVGEIFGRWFLPSTNARNEALLWALAGLAVLGISVVVVVRHAASSPPPNSGRAILPFGTFAAVYLAALLLVVPLTITFPIFGRLLTPFLVPVLLMAAFLLDRLLHLDARGGMAVFRWALASLLLTGGLANVGLHALTSYQLTARALDRGYIENRQLVPGHVLGGRTYNTAYWDDSEIVGYVKANPIAGPLYSNIPAALDWLTDVPAVRWIGSPEVVLSLVSCADPDNPHVIWHCNPGGCPDGTPGLEVVAELSDGLIFRRSADRGACFTRGLVPRVGEAFYSSLSLGIRIRGFTDRSPWQWEKGSDADGWTAIPGSAGPTYRYIPTAADVGHRLRAHVYYTDSDGTRGMAVTEPSEPVEGTASRR